METEHESRDRKVDNREPSDAVAELGALLKEAGARVTFDAARNNTHPCWFCGAPPTKTHALRNVGRYYNGTALTRPVCVTCQATVPIAAFAPLRDVVLNHLRDVIEWLSENKTAAAKAVGVDRRTLYRMLQRGERKSGGTP